MKNLHEKKQKQKRSRAKYGKNHKMKARLNKKFRQIKCVEMRNGPL
jgi:hypothetical protein